ncbi:MAG: tautomerase family protein [Armatimonadetes bacterium]|nr:tautomerase family protein [Armatimonadota bacterium]
MPTLHVHITGEPTAGQKRTLAKRLTEAVCRAVDKKPGDVTIYLYYHNGGAQDMAHAGVLASERLEAE